MACRNFRFRTRADIRRLGVPDLDVLVCSMDEGSIFGMGFVGGFALSGYRRRVRDSIGVFVGKVGWELFCTRDGQSASKARWYWSERASRETYDCHTGQKDAEVVEILDWYFDHAPLALTTSPGPPPCSSR